jgi:hypothetical protein
MSSCTNNSVISATFVPSTDATNGRRISFQQKTDTNWDPTIEAGNVIRFDVDEIIFTKSVADPYLNGEPDLSVAEVVGIVESISQINGITYATIVTHGLINYPGLTFNSTDGGAGGTDIFFLSPTISGGITAGIEENRGYIVKPVLQVCPVSDTNYNSIVVNYLGYESSEAESATLRLGESTVGDIKVVDANAELPRGWIEGSVPQYLPVREYSEAYQIYSTKYGAYEALTINGTSSFVSSLLNASIRPIDPITGRGVQNFFKVISVDTLNNKIVTEHTTNKHEFWKPQYTKYEILNYLSTETTLPNERPTIVRINVTNGEITHFKTPKIETNLVVNSGNEDQLVSFNTKTLLRVKRDTSAAYLPEQILFTNVDVGGVIKTKNISDLDQKLVEIETRIVALEQALGL